MENTPPASGAKIYPALIEAMREVGAVAKLGEYRERQDGPVQYRFRGVDAVVNAAGPALRKAGIFPVPVVLEAIRTPGTTKQGGSKMTTIVKVRYEFTAADGSHVDVVVEGEANDTSDKGTGKAMSVAMRIAYLQLFAIPTDDPDPDAMRVEGDHTPPLSPALVAYLRLHIDRAPSGDLPELWELLTAHVAADSRVPGEEVVWWELWAKRYLEEMATRATKDELAALWKEIGAFGVNFRLGKGETVGSRITDKATDWSQANLNAKRECIELIDASGDDAALDMAGQVIKDHLAAKNLLSGDSLTLLERLGKRRETLARRAADTKANLDSWHSDAGLHEDTTQGEMNEEQLG